MRFVKTALWSYLVLFSMVLVVSIVVLNTGAFLVCLLGLFLTTLGLLSA